MIAEAAELDDRGFVVDFRELDDVKQWIDATLDHRHLNDVMEGQPSAEAIARLVHDWCTANLPAPVAEGRRRAGVGDAEGVRRVPPRVTATTERPTPLVVSEVFGPTVPGRGPEPRAAGRLPPPRPLQPDCTWCDTPVHLGLGPVRPGRGAHGAGRRRRRRRGRGDGRRPGRGHRRRAAAATAPPRAVPRGGRGERAGRWRSRPTAPSLPRRRSPRWWRSSTCRPSWPTAAWRPRAIVPAALAALRQPPARRRSSSS